MKFFLRLIASFAMIMASLTAPALAETGASAKMKRVMPYMDRFLSAPEEERSLLRLVYRIKSRSQPESDIRAWYTLGGERYDLELNALGELMELPPLSNWRKNPVVETNIPRSDVRLSLRVRPNVKHSTAMSAPDLANSLIQARKGIRRVSGLFGFFRPKVKGYQFELPASVTDATAEIVYANGQTKPLQPVEINPEVSYVTLSEADLNNAVSVNFSDAPVIIRYLD